MVNHGQKTINYRPVTKEELKYQESFYSGVNLDTLTKAKYDSIQYKGISDGLKHYIIYTAKGMITRTDIWFYADKPLLHKMEYLYNPNMTGGNSNVEIDFNMSDVNKEIPEEIFRQDKYILKSGKQYKPAAAYTQYKLNISGYEE